MMRDCQNRRQVLRKQSKNCETICWISTNMERKFALNRHGQTLHRVDLPGLKTSQHCTFTGCTGSLEVQEGKNPISAMYVCHKSCKVRPDLTNCICSKKDGSLHSCSDYRKLNEFSKMYEPNTADTREYYLFRGSTNILEAGIRIKILAN